MSKLYLAKNVLEAAQERISLVFDYFEDITVSVSSGKDSTTLFGLVLAEAKKRNRKINLFFLDQEAEYASTIILMREMMAYPEVDPLWYQVPIYMTNATSYAQDFLYAWGENQEWMREKELFSIHQIEGEYPKRFYDFFQWFEKMRPNNSAFLVGIRAEESLNRFRAVVKNPSFNGLFWSSKTKNPTSHKFYPIYDWGMGDVWKYIADNDLSYNKIYNLMFKKNNKFYNTMRVSNLIHEKSFSCLTDLQELEPDTYEKLLKRVKGVHTAAVYAKEKMIFSAEQLPTRFSSWREYRDYLIETSPITNKEKFLNRLNSQDLADESVCRQQCRQLMINDWENNIPVVKVDKKKKEDWKAKWMEIL